ncbi:histidine kinase dimerization/phospho-acceptor domain-containing protein, partial [Streptomyces antimycoticus]|uniref:histidine kinase dimerization/phospho-acceptor domain-containing protein n=1 Tax=Streptomyces antimycoticus TaxID=68175 RepID=UPI003428C91A
MTRNRRERLGRLTIGARLTLSNTTVLTVGSLILLTLNWLSVRSLLNANRSLLVPASTIRDEPQPSATGSSPAATQLPPNVWPDVSSQSFDAFKDAIMRQFLTRSALLIVIIAALSLLAGWWIARRSLTRITQVTEAAQYIGETNLHDRLALTGPHDEVKKLGDTFDTMLDRLELSFTAQREFTALASHELRTPLTLTRTALEIPLAQRRVPDDLEPALRRALAATERSERLIASLLALARGESGLAHAHESDLADHVRTAVADVRDEVEHSKVALHTNLGPAPVTGDATLLVLQQRFAIWPGQRRRPECSRLVVCQGRSCRS